MLADGMRRLDNGVDGVEVGVQLKEAAPEPTDGTRSSKMCIAPL